MPDQPAVPVNRLDPMQGNEMRLSFLTNQLEITGAVLWESDSAKRHKDDYMLDPVVITAGKAHICVRAAAQNDGGTARFQRQRQQHGLQYQCDRPGAAAFAVETVDDENIRHLLNFSH